jgi:hypothetical protein
VHRARQCHTFRLEALTLLPLLFESVEHCKMMLQYESATRYWSTKNSLMSVSSSGYLKFEHPDRLQDKDYVRLEKTCRMTD